MRPEASRSIVQKRAVWSGRSLGSVPRNLGVSPPDRPPVLRATSSQTGQGSRGRRCPFRPLRDPEAGARGRLPAQTLDLEPVAQVPVRSAQRDLARASPSSAGRGDRVLYQSETYGGFKGLWRGAASTIGPVALVPLPVPASPRPSSARGIVGIRRGRHRVPR